MMIEKEIIEHGREMFVKCYNGIIPLPGPVEPDSFGELNLKLFHEVWGDDRLSFRDKRLIVIGVMGGRAGSRAPATSPLYLALENIIKEREGEGAKS